MTHVMACIDGSASSTAVCDFAAWASTRLGAPLNLLHVIDRSLYPQKGDLSGNIGLGSREHLLEQLAALDEQRSKLALEQGQLMLSAAKERVMAAGVTTVALQQRHGDLADTLHELEADIRLLVIGKQGDASPSAGQPMGSQLESVIRSLHRPILVTPNTFSAPQSLMLAFDASATSRKGVEMLAASPLFKGLPIHLVMVGPDVASNWQPLEHAASVLAGAGFEVHTALVQGDVEPALHKYQASHGVDLLVMGAYGHSRIREFLVGSSTTSMIRTSTSPLLLLR